MLWVLYIVNNNGWICEIYILKINTINNFKFIFIIILLYTYISIYDFFIEGFNVNKSNKSFNLINIIFLKQ